MNKTRIVMGLLALAAMTACGQGKSPDSTDGQGPGDSPGASAAANCPAADDAGNIDIAPGLTAKILKKGYGQVAADGDYADTNVWLWLFDESAPDRRGEFIWESGASVFQFQLGRGQVIRGWDLGVPCMLQGETRELVVAADLAYGSAGRGNIPPNATLIFTIELVKLTSPDQGG